MTREQFLKACPKASPDCLAENAKAYGWAPAPPPRAKRRTLAQIVTEDPPAVLPADIFTQFVPVAIRSEANLREHWAAKSKRVAGQKTAVSVCLAALSGKPKPKAVYFCRVGRHKLDRDNLTNAFKHVQDVVAALLGFDDRDESVLWHYQQITDPVGELGFSIVVDWRRLAPK